MVVRPCYRGARARHNLLLRQLVARLNFSVEALNVAASRELLPSFRHLFAVVKN